ncbi:MAG: hypothetical protein GY697_26465, partial [Desulfobacterales bacterium]|nr:hypothetical protein [Desulfobacterales bacterium]
TTSDSFTYTVTDSTNSSNTSTVSYVVTPVNDNAPVTTNNSYSLNEGALESGNNIITDDTGDGVDSDSDLPADTLTIESVNGTAWASLTDSTHGTYTSALGYKEVATTNGVVYILQDGTTQYQHDDSETSDSFTYTVSDSVNGSNTSTVSYVVTPVNDNAPVTTNNSYTLNEGALESGNNIISDDTGAGADSDSDLPADTLTIETVNGTAWASLTDSTHTTYTSGLG